MRERRRSDIRRHATLPKTWIPQENWQFETDRRGRITSIEEIIGLLDRPPEVAA